ncbi:hypothetical protein LCGC14_0514890 [marine sediment metagenome]|uniref:Uncharacterized protein n=1 Tax=marine sediment metagenome TaxID=412755 RepID=A0A0F9V8C5_9ZZZZ
MNGTITHGLRLKESFIILKTASWNSQLGGEIEINIWRFFESWISNSREVC